MRKQYLLNSIKTLENAKPEDKDMMNSMIVGQTEAVAMGEEESTYNQMTTYEALLKKMNKIFEEKYGCAVEFPKRECWARDEADGQMKPVSQIKDYQPRQKTKIEMHKVTFNNDGTMTDIVTYETF